MLSVRADYVLSPLHLENGPDPERNTDQCDKDTAQYFITPFEDAKPHTLQSGCRVDTQQHVGRDRADGGHDRRVCCQSRVSSYGAKGKVRTRSSLEFAGVRLIGTRSSTQRLKISCRKLQSAGRQTNML